MPALKLYYYDMGGRALPTRLILNHAGIAFEDVRMSGEELEKAMAAQPDVFPNATVPVMEIVDGERKVLLSQSRAIALYAARLAGLLPTDPLLLADVDEADAQLEDLMNALIATMGKEGDALKEAREAWAREDGAKSFRRLEAIYARGSAAGPFLHGAAPGPVDFSVMGVALWLQSGMLDHIPADILAAYPRLAAVVGACMGLESVQAFHKAHPQF